MRNHINNQSGYIALVTVLIIVAVTLAIAISINLLSISETQIGLFQDQTSQSFMVASGCLEEAYGQIKRNPGYTGDSLNLGQGSCTIQVVAQGNRRTITTSGQVGNFTRTIESEVNLAGGRFVVNYWRETY